MRVDILRANDNTENYWIGKTNAEFMVKKQWDICISINIFLFF